MEKNKIEEVVKLLDKVLKSKKSKFSPTDRECLVIVREQLKNAKNKRDINGPLKLIAKILEVAKSIYDQLK